jgi:DNA-directed RNA polymerase subunit K
MTVDSYTRFERARLIGARALQISEGAPPLIETDETDPIEIARTELEEDVLPIAVRSQHPGA